MASQNSLVLAFALGAAALFALFRAGPPAVVSSNVASERDRTPEAENAAPEEESLPPDHPPIGSMGPGELREVDETEPLPPNHPPIGGPNAAPELPSGDGAPEASIEWKVPASWLSVANTSGMRLATYRIPKASGVSEDAELSVVRAGGSPEANLGRWVQQFTAAEPEKRGKKTVHGKTVWLVEISGTFAAGSMGGGGAHAGWSLLGAIVEGGDDSYFFKLTGPTASVRAARKDFDALVDSIAPRAAGVPL